MPKKTETETETEPETSSISPDIEDNEYIKPNYDDTGEEKLTPPKMETPPKAKVKSPSLRSLLPGLQTALEKSTEALNRFAMNDLKDQTTEIFSDPKSSGNPPQSSEKPEQDQPIDPDPATEPARESEAGQKVREMPTRKRRWI